MAEITGYYVRVLREGKWESLDIAELRDPELEGFFAGQEPNRATRWAVALAKWIRDNVRRQ